MIEVALFIAALAVVGVCLAAIWTLWLLLGEARDDLAAAKGQNQWLEARCNALLQENNQRTRR